MSLSKLRQQTQKSAILSRFSDSKILISLQVECFLWPVWKQITTESKSRKTSFSVHSCVSLIGCNFIGRRKSDAVCSTLDFGRKQRPLKAVETSEPIGILRLHPFCGWTHFWTYWYFAISSGYAWNGHEKKSYYEPKIYEIVEKLKQWCILKTSLLVFLHCKCKTVQLQPDFNFLERSALH